MMSSDRSWRWTDAHYCGLTSQTNIYGMTRISNVNGTNRLLVASLKGDVVSVEYKKIQNKLKPCSRAVQFTYIPADAEIVSIDIMNKCDPGSGLVVGITFIRLQGGDNKPTGQFLNLYFSFEESSEEVKQDIMAKTIELSFVPYQLTHTLLVHNNDNKESIFLLCGSDNKIHMYKDEADNNFLEENPDEYFPEFKDCDSSTLRLVIKYTDNYTKRLTAMGFQSGTVKFSLVDVQKNVILKSWCSTHGNPITSIVIFNPQNQVPCPSFIESSQENGGIDEERTLIYHLLVTSALMPAVVYRNVLVEGLEDCLTLPNSEKYDSPLCSCVVDIDFDGQNEILIGTYGQELLAYKYTQQDAGSTLKQTEDIIPDIKKRLKFKTLNEESETLNLKKLKSSLESVASCASRNQSNESSPDRNYKKEGFELLWTRSFAYPVVGVDSIDIMGDGMEDLAVVTLKGLHILQPDLSEVAKVCLERLRILADTGSEVDDAYLELQNESLEGEI
ncbi:KICSTOR complex protein kaptin [Patella vulgata]|uniref:KICSTOR complex protein kaptin n=1 Tax=Patella vulgata TaxID=6465 RepID=UPI00217FF346|nr:KICSTOR complex protein kaptin [Patella vulgata]XP_050405173.1 KICSTOR complex protein kaptin [Patella vulgata]